MKPASRLWTLLVCAVALSGSGCKRAAGSDEADAASGKKEPVAVSVAMPVQRAFHAQVTGFGTLSGDSRSKQVLSLPQAGQVVALDVAVGHRVRRGQALLQLATDPTARGGYQQADNALQLARGELARTERLAADHLATNSQLATARKALADAQSALEQQSRLGGGSDRGVLLAPSDGVVTAVAVHPGERVQAGATLVEFTASGAVVAQLGVEPAQASSVRVGMGATIQPVYGAKAGLPGTVTMVGNAVDPQTHLVDVLVAVQGATEGMVSGAPLSGTIDTASFNAWAVPREAVLADEAGSYLYQVHQGKAHRIAVRVAAPDGDTLGVTGPLDAKDGVITLGAYELADGDPVQAQSSSGAGE